MNNPDSPSAPHAEPSTSIEDPANNPGPGNDWYHNNGSQLNGNQHALISHMQSPMNYDFMIPHSYAVSNPGNPTMNSHNLQGSQPYHEAWPMYQASLPGWNIFTTSNISLGFLRHNRTPSNNFNSAISYPSNDGYQRQIAIAHSSTVNATHQPSQTSTATNTAPQVASLSPQSFTQECDLLSSVGSTPTASAISYNSDAGDMATKQSKGDPSAKSKNTTKRKHTPISEENDHIKTFRPKTKLAHDHPDANFSVWKLPGQPSKKKSKQEREKTRRTRRAKACGYHKRRHETCDPRWRPYIECVNVPRKTIIFMKKPKDISLFRPRPAQGHPLLQREAVLCLMEISDSTTFNFPVQLSLTQGLDTRLDVDASPFIPRQGDKSDHFWYQQGRRITIGMPKYCIGPVENARKQVGRYIVSALQKYVEDVLDSSGETVHEVLSYAKQYAKQSKSTLVSGALQLLAVNRMIERDWHICGPKTLGIQRVDEAECPWYGKIPITPMMDTQLDQIVIQDYLMPLRNQLLSELQEKMHDENANNLFEIFLAVFILATNLEWLLRHSRLNAKRYNAKYRYNSIKLAQEYFNGHNVLLSHFHHLTKGSGVSAASSTADSSSGNGLTTEQSEFMIRIRSKISGKREELHRMRQEKQYEQELYWSHQLFREGWEPESTEVVDEGVHS